MNFLSFSEPLYKSLIEKAKVYKRQCFARLTPFLAFGVLGHHCIAKINAVDHAVSRAHLNGHDWRVIGLLLVRMMYHIRLIVVRMCHV